MPHQCTNCGRVFADGSKEMLSGCPDCGGNKFQFHPSDADVPDEPTADPPDPPGPDSSVARTVGNAAATVRDVVGGSRLGSDPAEDLPGEDEPRPDPDAPTPDPDAEDPAQADARSQVVASDELPDGHAAGEPDDVEPRAVDPPAPGEERPDLTELRRELNDQFESIKVLQPGQYELNLMELYDREEYIIALQEDGRYTIQVPETWRG